MSAAQQQTRAEELLRQAVDLLNDRPNFGLRRDASVTSYKLASQIEAHFRGAERPQGNNPYHVVCPKCGSPNVTRDCIGRWDFEHQVWEVSGELDNMDCDDCGHDGSVFDAVEEINLSDAQRATIFDGAHYVRGEIDEATDAAMERENVANQLFENRGSIAHRGRDSIPKSHRAEGNNFVD